jgi:glutamine synthetase
MATSAEAILQQVEEQQIEFISLQFTDIVGMLKNVTIPAGRLGDCLDHGVWFDGSSIEGLSRTRIAESDMFLVPDLTTFGVIPWDQDTNITTARLICDVYTPDGKPFAGDPRSVLKRVIDEAAQLGYTLNVSPEVEFFLFRLDDHDRPILIPHDVAGYFDTSTDLATSIRRRMVRALQKFGIDVEATHHEVEIGQHEIDLRYGPALRLADSIITFRTTLKAIAQQHRLYATFMPKPLDGINGSGMHLHLSLADIRTEKNLFYATDDPYELSPLARHFTAGLLEHAKGMTAILAPLVNSYKRLMPGYEAPVYLSWGRTARSALVRIPRISPARPQTARVELRCPDPSCNPYLALAVVLKAGLDGVKRKLPPPEPVEEDLYLVDPRAYQLDKLPGSLGEALDELQQDDVIADALGPHILERFVEAKTQEWNEYRTNVTQWELDRYLPTY